MEAAGSHLQPPPRQSLIVPNQRRKPESRSAGGVGCTGEAGGPGALVGTCSAPLWRGCCETGRAGRVPGDRFAVGWGLVGCWAACSGAGRVGRRGESHWSHGEDTQVLRLRLDPGPGLGLSLGLEEGFAEVGLAAPFPAAWRGCQVGGEEGFEQEHRDSGREPHAPDPE